MKTIGMIGGMSWESTVPYYQEINGAVAAALGGLHSAKCLLYSVDFHEIERRMAAGAWDECADILADAAGRLERGGADFVVICTNTLHKVAPEIARRIGIPILHIADATADALISSGIRKVGLLGTKYTMTQDFIRGKLEERGIEALVPPAEDMELVNEVIFGELCRGILPPQSKAEYLRIIRALADRGAQGVVLGCTEIGMLVSQSDTDVPLFDTTVIHARRAAEWAMA